MNVTQDDFRRHFEMLSDAALLSTNRDDLTRAAQACFDEEVGRRGLEGPGAGDVEDPADIQPGRAEAGDKAEASADEPGFVVVEVYTNSEEASLALGLLRSAEIPSSISTQYIPMGGADFKLIVPAEFEEHALEILGHELSDEELAAQAEAAGEFEAEEEGEFEEESESEESQAEEAE